MADLEDELAHALEQAINWNLHAKRLLARIADPAPPWEEQSALELDAVAATAPDPAAAKKALTPEATCKALNEAYPHGWSESGNKRPPGLKKTLANLRAAKRKGWSMDVILDGAKRMAEAIGQSEDRKYSPSLHRWVKDELWLEVPEPLVPKKKEKTEAEIAGDKVAADLARKRRVKAQAERAGVQMDDEGNVLDWGPQGRPDVR